MTKFTKTHEWVAVEGKEATIGITDYAQRELGNIVYIELPAIGHKIKAGDESCVLESTKAATDVYAPLSGVVTAINEKVKENPQLINDSPEGEGWLFKIEASHLEELEQLLDRDSYQNKLH